MKVLKFGGAAFTKPEDFQNIAALIESEPGPIVVVTSAMYKMTDALTDLAYSVADAPPKRELDMLLSVGERVSMSLLAMALKRPAVSFTGSQSGIITTEDHSDAYILEVTPCRIREALAQNKVVIVAGFQGVSRKKEITTLGRGGSDTTAVALAVALGAESVIFYKDVPAVYSSDPKTCPEATPYNFLSYEKALSIANVGHAIVHPRAIALASKNHLPLHVRSFKRSLLNEGEGTWIGVKSGIKVPPTYERAYVGSDRDKEPLLPTC